MESHGAKIPAAKALPKIRTVCVFGGSGFVGQHIVHQLNDAGYNVLVPTRHRERAKELIVLPTVDVVEANVHDPLELSSLLAGVDAVINLVGILHEHKTGRVDKPSARRGDFHEAHVELPRKILHACGEHGIRRLLHMSALNADATARSAYLRSKGVGEAIVREADLPHSENERWFLDGPKFVKGQNMATTVFRPSVIFGRGDSFLTMLGRLIHTFPILPLACPGAKFQPIFVDDVARAYVSALENPATFGEAYDLCGPKVYTLAELVDYVAGLNGRYRTIINLSDRLSYWNAFLLEHLPGKLMTRDNYYSMQVDNVCKCAFPSVFGFQPTALEIVAPHYLSNSAIHSKYDELRNMARRR
jgi:NADH dehydrogenase